MVNSWSSSSTMYRQTLPQPSSVKTTWRYQSTILTQSIVGNRWHPPGTSFQKSLWTTSQSASPCSSSTCSRSRRLISQSTARHSTTIRWKTSIQTFSSTFSTWRVQRRHWQEITTHRSSNSSVIIDFMDPSLSHWLKTRPRTSWSVLLYRTWSW